MVGRNVEMEMRTDLSDAFGVTSRRETLTPIVAKSESGRSQYSAYYMPGEYSYVRGAIERTKIREAIWSTYSTNILFSYAATSAR